MTMVTQNCLPTGTTFMGRMKLRVKAWRDDRAYRKSLELVPESLRYDVGIDGGAPVGVSQDGRGHSFDHTRELPAVIRFQ